MEGVARSAVLLMFINLEEDSSLQLKGLALAP